MRTPKRVPASFRGLLLGSLFLLRSWHMQVCTAIVFFALLGAVVSTFVGGEIDGIEKKLSADAGIQLENLGEKVGVSMQTLEEGEIILFAERMRATGFAPSDTITDETIGLEYAVRVGPYVLALVLCDFLILLIAGTFFLRLFLRPETGGIGAAQKTPLLTLKMLALFFWMFFRSFVWIPLVGPVLAIYFFPRIAIAPAILIAEEATLFQSTHVSVMRTSHMWGNVFLAFLGLAVIGFLLLWIFLVLSSIVGLFMLKAGFFLWLCCVFLVTAWSAAYVSVLSASLE